jgi:fibro-slime domain-containing protein
MVVPRAGHDARVHGWHVSTGSALRGLFCGGLTLGLVGCSAGDDPASQIGAPGAGAPAIGNGAGPSASQGSGGTSGIMLAVGGMAPDAGTGGVDPAHQAITSLPAGFTATDIGGFQLGSRVEAGGGGGSSAGGIGGSAGNGGGPAGDCGNVLLGVVRDFKGSDEGGHPDFETPKIYGGDVTTGLVSPTLGTDRKPVYTSKCELANPGGKDVCPYGAETTTHANFDQWYRDTQGVNDAYIVSFYFAPRPGGLFTFQSLSYFPIDGAGFMGMAKADDGKLHNFGFTTELHTQFLYKGAETFTFQGDDDVWVYINDKLAVDVGGLHPMQLRSVMLDTVANELGLVKGRIYPLDLFHAERHTTASTFRIDTNLSFVDCGTVLPGKVK